MTSNEHEHENPTTEGAQPAEHPNGAAKPVNGGMPVNRMTSRQTCR
jgi:hypothetical protein